MRTIALTRDLISRAFPQPVGDDKAAMRLLTDEEIAAHLEAALGARPEVDQELWLFAYGSLMWKPEFDFVEQHIATVRGWHRRFCLWQWRHRGTCDRPGVMLALDRGGSCQGVVYKLTGPDIRAKIGPVWRREMSANGYRPRWITATTDADPVLAIAFIANRKGERYAGRLTDEAIADRIAAACGHIGPSAEYLLETVVRCEELGIHDRHLWRMQALVADRLLRGAAAPRPEAVG
jgi:glutathione-specific gamma-glutamylcyclotransferase